MLSTEKEVPDMLCCAKDMYCVGPKCMGWRWREAEPMWQVSPHPEIVREGEPEPKKPKHVRKTWAWVPYDEVDGLCGWVEPDEEIQARRRGYCGLAGEVKFP